MTAGAAASSMAQMQAAKYDMYGQLGSAVIGSIGSLFGANASSKKQYQYQSALQRQAAKLNYEYAEKTARNSPTWNRAGLESAGYNPMLAVQNATSGANSSWTSSGQATAPDYVGAISQGIANAQSFQRLKNESIVAEQTSKKLESEGENLNADTANKLEENKYISPMRKAEIANIQGDTLLKEAQIDNMIKQIELGQMGITVQQEANANDAERNRILEKISPSGKSSSFRNYAQGTRDILSGFGDIIHGRTDNYENYTETREVTNGPKGRSSEKVTSKRSGRRKKR